MKLYEYNYSANENIVHIYSAEIDETFGIGAKPDSFDDRHIKYFVEKGDDEFYYLSKDQIDKVKIVQSEDDCNFVLYTLSDDKVYVCEKLYMAVSDWYNRIQAAANQIKIISDNLEEKLNKAKEGTLVPIKPKKEPN